MSHGNLALGFYQDLAVAQQVLHQLTRKGFKRAAAIQRIDDDHVVIHQDPNSRFFLYANVILALLVLLSSWLFPALQSIFIGILLLAIGVSAIAWLVGYFYNQIDPALIQRFQNQVLPNEVLILVQVRTRDTRHVLAILRQVPNGHPASFLLRSDSPTLNVYQELISEPLTQEQMQAKAIQIAEKIKNTPLIISRNSALLQQLQHSASVLNNIRYNVGEAQHIEQTISLAAEWLLDNNYVIQGNLIEVLRSLPKKYYRELPKVNYSNTGTVPRAYLIGKEILSGTASKLSRESITTFLKSYQTVQPLTIGELWALPLFLRMILIENIQSLALHIDRRLCEGEQASFWGYRLIQAARRHPQQLPLFLAEIAKENPHPSPHFAEELLDHLADEETVLPLVRSWLEERLLVPIPEVIYREQLRKTTEQVALSNAIVSLITLSQLSWREIFEELSIVDSILKDDPAGVYTQMNFTTHDTYRHAIEVIAKHCSLSETDIAKHLLKLANNGKNDIEHHVGYYLIDAGRPILEKSVQCQPSCLQKIRRWLLLHPAQAYIGSITLLTVLFELALLAAAISYGTTAGQTILLMILALLPVSEIAVQAVNLILVRLLPPFVMPKMSFKEGIPTKYKTIVVIPMMLLTRDSIRENINHLEVHYLANNDPQLIFALFSDFADAPQQSMPEDSELLESAIIGITTLINKYGKDKFFLFHRPRTWSASENAWIGDERKRGKLECLNHLLCNFQEDSPLIQIGSPSALRDIRYVITLDADTQLPKDSARQLIETLAHPLNAPEISAEGRLTRGYTIIQPRVSTDFPQAQVSLFTRLFADVIGLDPYTQVVSDIYQDLTREGTYHGKGIYDLHVFHKLLNNHFPQEHILSHDLIEGAYARVGFASDIALFDCYPPNYLTWSRRQHRWMRGDWQIADWLLSYVPTANQHRIQNTLSAINRWKIFDNLRRSILPITTLALLVSAWLIASSPTLWTALATLVLFMPAIAFIFCQYLPHPSLLFKMASQPLKALTKAIVYIALLPHQAWLSLDALVRVIYRRFYSHKYLLEWTTGNHSSKEMHQRFLLKLSAVSLFGILVTAAVAYFNPKALILALPFTLLWLIAPAIVAYLDKPRSTDPAEELSDKDRLFLRQVARRTWRYFDEFVGPSTHWLPPDNYQAALEIEVAQRTSPTNIGLWMLAVLSAHDLKYISEDDVIDRLLATFQTLHKLERYEGHLLNWYSTFSLAPLYPRYVSTVDSGNFLASLWTLEQGVYQMLSNPILQFSLLDGLNDTFTEIDTHLHPEFDSVRSHLQIKPKTLPELIDTINATAIAVELVTHQQKETNHENNYWLQKLGQQLQAWQNQIARYCSWIPLLNTPPHIAETQLALHLHQWCEHTLKTAPSLRQLASGSLLKQLDHFITLTQQQNIPAELNSWLLNVREALQTAQWLAGEKMGDVQEILSELHSLSDGMNMRFLYNQERKFFSIGYNVDDRRLDNSYYDLLASEARIASLVAIAKGDAPVEHWWALGRPYAIVKGRQVLRSWGGTMFEYLMPLLFNKYYSTSLLGQACYSAVMCQMDYGKRRGIPWGISEAAFSAIDARKTYQYRSFGVPGLGFKRDLEEDIVVSPYSSALALLVTPKAAIHNLKQLASADHNLWSNYGYYESIDFTRQRGPHGERGVIIYAYMAHHQGMALIAINNTLNREIMPDRFHSSPYISGVDSMLYERIPINPPISKSYHKEPHATRLIPFSSIPVMGVSDTPHTTTPKINLLSNGTYSVMMTNAGGGYSRWRNWDITRWSADTTCDNGGSYCYIRDTESGYYWSTAYNPTHHRSHKYSVSFKADKVEIRRRDQSIETITEIVVDPEDSAEVRFLTLANFDDKPRHLTITSYVELALAPHAADRAHPCFNKLFIATEALEEFPGLIAYRRLRSPDDQPLFAVHTLALEQPHAVNYEYETSRTLFIGRGKTLQTPQALEQSLSNTQGYVLDPIFSLRHSVSLAPGERVRFAFITAATDSREGAISLLQKYTNLSASQRAIDMAWTHAQLELRHLRIQQEEAQLFQKLASRILYPDAQLRPSTERLRSNALGQSELWAHGISGDLPIVVVCVADSHELTLVRQVIVAHTFWRLRGLQVDLVIINEEATSYEHPLFDQLQRCIQVHAYQSPIEQSGGVYLRTADQLSREDLTLLMSVARVTLIAARGSLRQQLVSPTPPITIPKRLIPTRKGAEEPSNPLPFLELPYFNGFGGFTGDGREYVIYLGPDTHTPAPWINVIANKSFGTIVSEAGLGSTWYGNSQTNRLTPWSNDPLVNPITDALYIRDEETGNFWTPTPGPIRELDAYRIRHGQGYTRFEHNSHGIEQELTITVPTDADGGMPLRLQTLKLHNTSSRTRYLTITGYSEWVLGTNREETQAHIITEWDAESQSMFAYNRYQTDFRSCLAFNTSIPAPSSYTANRTEFIGRNISHANPAALKRKYLSGSTGAALDPCSALQVQVEIPANSTIEVLFIMGYAQNPTQARQLITQCHLPDFQNTALNTTIAFWDSILDTVQIDVSDLAVNFACNRWLLYQTLSCRIWGRTAFYQSSGAYGFRDQLQDVLALLYTAPQIARQHILYAAAHQFKEGDVQHWWHPPSDAGVRTRITDDLLWLPYATAHYVSVTKDDSILKEMVPFLEGPTLTDEQHELYFVPTVSEEQSTLLDHCRRAIQRATTSGSHGLPLIGGGDWNDGMNRVGIDGRGESVWLAWFLIRVLRDFSAMLANTEEAAASKGLLLEAKRLAENIEKQAWDGEWYRRAYFDDGTPLGSKDSIEASIDSLAQSWAVISGVADPKRTATALQSLKQHLIRNDDGMVLLLTPPFDKSDVDPGYIKGYPPGVRENGGQYTHGSLWVPLAFARYGDGNTAASLLQMMHPINHTQNPDTVARYCTEPYALAGDVYALPGKIGRGGWSWYTGASGWMYRIWIEEVIGLQIHGDELTFKPSLPTHWTNFNVRYRYRSTTYNITFDNSQQVSNGKPQITLDATPLDSSTITLVDDGKEHTVEVAIKAP